LRKYDAQTRGYVVSETARGNALAEYIIAGDFTPPDQNSGCIRCSLWSRIPIYRKASARETR